MKKYLFFFLIFGFIFFFTPEDSYADPTLTCFSSNCQPGPDIDVCVDANITCSCPGQQSSCPFFNPPRTCSGTECNHQEKCQCTPYVCSNGIDDDGDGLTDYPADPGCTDPEDFSEVNAPVPTPTPPPANAWVDVYVNTTPEDMNWVLECPTGSYSCDGASGTGDELPMSASKCNNGACAGTGTYTVFNGGNTGYTCTGSSDVRNNPPPNVDQINLNLNCTPTASPTPTPTPTPTPPPVCPATAPVGLNTTNITQTSAKLNWTPGAGGTRQLLRVGPNQGEVNSGCGGSPTTCKVVENNLSTSQNNYQISNGVLQAGTLYYWRIVNFFDPQVCWADASSTFTTQPNTAPTVLNVTVSEPDYCSTAPAATVGWTFSDPGDTQTAYQIQITKGAFKSNPDYDSGKVISNGNSRYISPPTLDWNTTYKARVMVWDSSDTPSAWVDMSVCNGPPSNPSGCQPGNNQWKTPQHSYPSGVNFSWSPSKPVINMSVSFKDVWPFNAPYTNQTTCYKTPPNTVDTCNEWRWVWGDGSSLIGATQNPTHTYTSEGNFTVTFQVKDQVSPGIAYVCPVIPLAKNISIQKPPPNWKEVLPH
ncbi:MAG: PKD domain-containing protein [Candidatus Yanofskybacteria bacterium]|nr:PKD domain-containing protein [Candidatus Yanofskybacteria bacterium]